VATGRSGHRFLISIGTHIMPSSALVFAIVADL